MKNRYTIFGCLTALMGVMIGMFGCTDELDGVRNTSTRPSDVICFTASLADSRAASVSRSASGHLAIEQEEWLVGTEAEQGVSRGAPVTLLSGSAGVIGYGDDDIVWSDNAEYVFDGDIELALTTKDVASVFCHPQKEYYLDIECENGTAENVKVTLTPLTDTVEEKAKLEYPAGLQYVLILYFHPFNVVDGVCTLKEWNAQNEDLYPDTN